MFVIIFEEGTVSGAVIWLMQPEQQKQSNKPKQMSTKYMYYSPDFTDFSLDCNPCTYRMIRMLVSLYLCICVLYILYALDPRRVVDICRKQNNAMS